jgi:PKD repeat protein
VANFSAKSLGCSPLTVKFTDLSTNIPTSWVWDFGNGQLSSLQNPTVNFSTPGTYTVKLIARNTAGIDEEEKVNYITVFPSPAASFRANITTACVPATIQFTDQSTSPPNGGTYILELEFWRWWYFNVQNPSHQYTAVDFTVSLLITSSTGCQVMLQSVDTLGLLTIDADFVYSQPTTPGILVSA